MIGYAMLGSNDLPRALGFYDQVAGALGATRMMGDERFQVYGTSAPTLGICLPFNGAAATAGNGTMLALSASSRAAVDTVHAMALQAGGADEGAPGLRGGDDANFYAAYFRDLDGNKLCVFHVG